MNDYEDPAPYIPPPPPQGRDSWLGAIAGAPRALFDKSQELIRGGIVNTLGVTPDAMVRKYQSLKERYPKLEPEEDKIVHSVASKGLTNLLGNYFGPKGSAQLADLAGLARETVTGGLDAIQGKPFYSESGFDWNDIAANREGQNDAIANWKGANPSWLSPLAAAAEWFGEGRPRN